MYEKHFGLSAKPFQLNPDPDFFFGSRGHRRAMAYLEYGLHQAEGFIVITGEVGAGKTTLVRGLLRRIQDDRISPAQIVSTQVDSDDLLRLVASAYGIATEGLDKATLLVRLSAHFEGLHADGRRALLIVDEAQNLSPRAVEELRMLSNFQLGTQSLVQSFLVGQPEFRAIMRRPEMRQLKQRVIASYHLGPLDGSETRHYVEHRLRHVGWNGDPSFDVEAFDEIHAASGGVPRRINAVCDRLLLATFLAERHAIGLDDVRAVTTELEAELGDPVATEEPPTLADVHTLPFARPPSHSAAGTVTRMRADPDAELAASIVHLEERISTLEASNEMLLNLVKKLLRVMRENSALSERNQSTGS
jgi:general secretion pathway protein A